MDDKPESGELAEAGRRKFLGLVGGGGIAIATTALLPQAAAVVVSGKPEIPGYDWNQHH